MSLAILRGIWAALTAIVGLIHLTWEKRLPRLQAARCGFILELEKEEVWGLSIWRQTAPSWVGERGREGKLEMEWVFVSSNYSTNTLLLSPASAENKGSGQSSESEAEHPPWGWGWGNSRGSWEGRGTTVDTPVCGMGSYVGQVVIRQELPVLH